MASSCLCLGDEVEMLTFSTTSASSLGKNRSWCLFCSSVLRALLSGVQTPISRRLDLQERTHREPSQRVLGVSPRLLPRNSTHVSRMSRLEVPSLDHWISMAFSCCNSHGPPQMVSSLESRARDLLWSTEIVPDGAGSWRSWSIP